MSKHKHADLILQYALDAMETDTPWDRWEWLSRDKEVGCRGLSDGDGFFSPFSYHRKADAPPVPWHLLPDKPKKKPVDVSALINSGIDLEWRRFDCDPYDDWQKDGDIENLFNKGHRIRPRMDYWFSGLNSFVREAGLSYITAKLEAAGFAVDCDRNNYAFRITGLQDGYCWPWEME